MLCDIRFLRSSAGGKTKSCAWMKSCSQSFIISSTDLSPHRSAVQMHYRELYRSINTTNRIFLSFLTAYSKRRLKKRKSKKGLEKILEKDSDVIRLRIGSTESTLWLERTSFKKVRMLCQNERKCLAWSNSEWCAIFRTGDKTLNFHLELFQVARVLPASFSDFPRK